MGKSRGANRGAQTHGLYGNEGGALWWLGYIPGLGSGSNACGPPSRRGDVQPVHPIPGYAGLRALQSHQGILAAQASDTQFSKQVHITTTPFPLHNYSKEARDAGRSKQGILNSHGTNT